MPSGGDRLVEAAERLEGVRGATVADCRLAAQALRLIARIDMSFVGGTIHEWQDRAERERHPVATAKYLEIADWFRDLRALHVEATGV